MLEAEQEQEVNYRRVVEHVVLGLLLLRAALCGCFGIMTYFASAMGPFDFSGFYMR